MGFFIVPLSNWHPFNLLLFFLGFVFSLFSQLKNFTHPFSWQSDSALWCSAASWFFQVLQGRVSQIDISCGSVPSQLGDSPEVQCCVARQTVKKRRKSLWLQFNFTLCPFIKTHNPNKITMAVAVLIHLVGIPPAFYISY